MDLVHEAHLIWVKGIITAAKDDVITPTHGVNCSDFGGVTFIFGMGEITATAELSIKAQQSNDDGVLDAYADIVGSGVSVLDTEGNKLVILDVRDPVKKWVLPIITRATANVEIAFILAIVHSAKKCPVVVDASASHVKSIANAIAGTP